MNLDFDKEMIIELKNEYNKAVEEGREQFPFMDTILITSYAKYLIEYLESKFDKVN